MNARILPVSALNECGITDNVDAGIEHIGRIRMGWPYGGEKFHIQKTQSNRPQIVQGVFNVRIRRNNR